MEITREVLNELYTIKKLPLGDISKIFGYKSRTSVSNLLRKFNIPHRQPLQKYYANDTFFSTWSHEMAYCLGFITADGHVWKNRTFVTIRISDKDRAILEFIRNHMSPTSKVREDSKHCQVQICIKSQQIWDDLQKYGVNHDKTFGLKVDFDIPNEYWPDYLRGFFDGDGSIWSITRRTQPYFYSSFSCASRPMLDYLQNRLGMGSIRCLRGKYYELKFCQPDTVKLGKIMYEEPCCFKLQRKYDRFQEISTNYIWWTESETQIMLDNIHLPTRKIAELLQGRTKVSVQSKKNKLVRTLCSQNVL